MATKTQLVEYVRFRLDQQGTSWLKTTQAGQFDLYEGINEAYRKWAILTKCFEVEYDLASVADTHTYAFSAFGAQAADTDSISVAAAADNTTAFTLVAGQPTERTPVSITLKNDTGGISSGNAVTYTIVGTRWGLEAYTETVAFTAAELLNAADQAEVTHQTLQYFEDVTSITPDSSGAQPASWEHYAGIPALSSGSRIFEVRTAYYNESELYRRADHDMQMVNARWRFADSGTPKYWIPMGRRGLRLWRPPSSTDEIRLVAWETPDMTSFALATDSPLLPDEDAYAMSLWAAILASGVNPNDESSFRQSVFFPEWEAAWKASHRRIHGRGNQTIQFGKYATREVIDGFVASDTIVTLP